MRARPARAREVEILRASTNYFCVRGDVRQETLDRFPARGRARLDLVHAVPVHGRVVFAAKRSGANLFRAISGDAIA